MKATHEMLVNAIIGKGLVGDVNQQNQEAHLFEKLGLGTDQGKDFFGHKFKFDRTVLEALSLKDLQFIYMREYEKQFDPKILISTITPSKRAN